MDRRSFLAGTGTLALSQLLTACSEQDKAKLRVQLLKGSIPAQVVNKLSLFTNHLTFEAFAFKAIH